MSLLGLIALMMTHTQHSCTHADTHPYTQIRYLCVSAEHKGWRIGHQSDCCRYGKEGVALIN